MDQNKKCKSIRKVLAARHEKKGKSAKSKNEETIFHDYTPGVNTGRDAVVYSFDKNELLSRMEAYCETYNSEVDRYKRKGKVANIDDFVDYSKIKWSETLKRRLPSGNYAEFNPAQIRRGLYRPFTKRHIYYDPVFTDRPGLFRRAFPGKNIKENCVILTSDIAYRAKTFSTLITDGHADMHLCASLDAHQCFPLYIYDEDGSNRRDNITNWALQQFQEQYKSKKITKRNIFDYIYGVLHHTGYREKYADNLKRELPRIPFAPNFKAFSTAGEHLANLHLTYESLKPWPLEEVETPNVPHSYRVEKMKLSKDKKTLKINESLTLANIPPEVFEYRLGNRSALEWVIDQYQVSEDKESGICSDPNRADDPEYIVRLVGQVVQVSMETLKIIRALPKFE